MKQFAFTTALLLGAVGRSGHGPDRLSPLLLQGEREPGREERGPRSRNAVRPRDPDRSGEILSTNLRSVYDPSYRPAGPVLPAPEGGGGHALGTCTCSGAPLENEANCGLPSDNTNGGCNYLPHVFGAITVGSSVCGTAAFDGGTRDTDWYRFSLSTTTTVVWTVRAEYPVEVLFLTDACPTSAIAQNFGAACTDTSVTATLAPGTYIAWTVPDFSGPVINCGVSDDYHGTLIGVSACAYDDGVSNDSIGLGNFGGGEELYLHKMGGMGEFAQVSSVSMAGALRSSRGTPSRRARRRRSGSSRIRTTTAFRTTSSRSPRRTSTHAAPDTDILQTVNLTSPVQISGVYFVGVSLFSGAGQFPLAIDYNTPSANRGWLCFETAGSGGMINYANLPSNDFFGENSTFGINGVYLLRANCQPLEGGCKYDDGFAETETAYSYAGEKLFLHKAGAVGDVSEIRAISMSWGSTAIPGFSVPNGTPALIRILEDPDDDGIPDDAVVIASQALVTADADTASSTRRRSVRRSSSGVSTSTASRSSRGRTSSRSAATRRRRRTTAPGSSDRNGGAINYGNLPSNTSFGELSFLGLDAVHMLRADCRPTDEISAFCAPGVAGIVTCPCGNPQIPAGATKGCNNFAGGGTGGAILAGSGAATIAGDTIAMNVSQGVASNVTVLFQGTTNNANARTGAGVRCVGGTLKRLYKGNQAAGSIAFPNNAVPFHLQSIAKGFTITPPVTLYYYAAYRNSAANGQPGCPGLNFGFNSTNALAVIWTP
jgi:hypothetical protein